MKAVIAFLVVGCGSEPFGAKLFERADGGAPDVGASGASGASGTPDAAPADAACSNRALVLPGTAGSFVRFPVEPLGAAPFTVELWARTGANEQIDVAHVGPESPCGWGVWVKGDVIHAGATAAFDHFAETPSSNAWRHVAWTFDGQESVLFVGGAVANRKTATAPPGLPGHCSNALTIGALVNPVGTPYGWSKGLVDELRLSRVVRYTGTFTPNNHHEPDASTVGLWNFDEADGEFVGDVRRECR